MSNLLGNAIKFSEPGRRVVIGARARDGEVVVSVQDQGVGIPKAQQAEIFKPLVRGTNLDEVTGTGVGLTIVSKLVNFLHGTIALTSVEGTGTTVTVRVPLEVPRGELSSGR